VMLGCWLWHFTLEQDLGLTKNPGIVLIIDLFLMLLYPIFVI